MQDLLPIDEPLLLELVTMQSLNHRPRYITPFAFRRLVEHHYHEVELIPDFLHESDFKWMLSSFERLVLGQIELLQNPFRQPEVIELE